MKSMHHYFYAGGYVFNMAATVAMNVLVARFLGAAAYGLLAIARAIYAIVLLITPLGMDLGLQRHLAPSAGKGALASRLVQFARRCSFAASAGTFALLAIASPFLSRIYDAPSLTWALIFTVLALPFSTDVVIIAAIGRVRDRLHPYIGAILILQPTLRLGLTAAVLWMGFGVVTVAAVSTAGIVASWALYRLLEPPPRDRTDLCSDEYRASRNSLSETSLWLAFSLLFYGLSRSADLLIVGLFVDGESLGRYAAVGSIAVMVQALSLSFGQSLAPKVAAAHAKGDADGLRFAIRDTLRRSIPVSLFLFGGVAGFGTDLHILFGPDFRVSFIVPFFLALGYLIGGVFGMSGYALSMTGRHRAESILIIVGGAGSIVGSLIGASLYGIEGAAIAACLVLGAVNLMRLVLVRTLQGTSFPEAAWIFGAAPALGLALLARHGAQLTVSGSVLQFLLGTVVYTLVAGVAYLAYRHVSSWRLAAG